MNNPYNRYKKTEITTASNGKILLMLYEGAIRFIRHARAAMNDKKIAEKGKYISKTTAIISELMATLDFDKGGQLAVDLENLYVFLIDKLIDCNINNDPQGLDVVEDILKTLYSGWKDVVENPRPDGVPSSRLQPEDYQKWRDGDQKMEPVKTSDRQSSADDRPKLKLMA